jgi:hypothetical protein
MLCSQKVEAKGLSHTAFNRVLDQNIFQKTGVYRSAENAKNQNPSNEEMDKRV